MWTLIFIGGLGILGAFGEDRIETMQIAHKGNPVTCILEPHPDNQEQFQNDALLGTWEAIRLWESELTAYTGGNWILPTKYIEWEDHKTKLVEDYPECNIFIGYEGLNEGEGPVKSSALGYAYLDFSHSAHNWAFVNVYMKAYSESPHITLCIGCDKDPEVTYTKDKLTNLPADTIKKIVIHEYGHALGIGHYIEDRSVMNNMNSTMYPVMKPFGEQDLTIGWVDKECLVQIYGKDGFGGVYGFTPYYFTINHEVPSLIWR